ncbi:MAG: chemotaxis protein CheW [Deltaproteobacteria bacterium]|jgi:two-component system chemotaxis sensor kinase CheA|nr:chemotaxis protein CheW [Deltaproteobacteria bacterium]
MATEMDDLIKEYLIESSEHLETIEQDLITIEEGGADIDEELVNKVFRAAHSIKGGAGFFNLTAIQSVGHKTENILDLIRSRKLIPTPEVVSVLFRAFDQLKIFVDDYQNSDKVDTSTLLADLACIIEGKPIAGGAPTPAKATNTTPTTSTTTSVEQCEIDLKTLDFDKLAADGRFIYLIKYDLVRDVHAKGKSISAFMKHLLSGGEILQCSLPLEQVDKLDFNNLTSKPFEVLFATILDPVVVGGLLETEDSQILGLDKIKECAALQAANPPEPAKTTPEVKAQATASAATKTTSQPTNSDKKMFDEDATLRVRVSLLESLMNLASELVLSRNQLNGAINNGDERLIHASGQRINLVTSDLQEAIMLARMQPVGNIFNKFPRVVRDLAGELGKKIDLEIVGKDVEMDKTIIEGLSDPLTHMIRNSVDHGIELPETRKAVGKSETGTVKIEAYHEAGQVVIEISDDGKGLAVEKIVEKAVKNNAITQTQADEMSEKEKMGLVFLPGLSTAEKITNVSGRGVGMDVVKTNLDKLGGKIEIDSEVGMGTSFKIKLPLTLAIIPSLLVSLGDECFAIPQVNVGELILIPKEQVAKKIELVGSAEVLRLRGKLIPILHLSEVLGIDKEKEDNLDLSQLPPQEQLAKLVESRSQRKNTKFRKIEKDLNVVIVNAGSFHYGLIVDGLHDTIEIVVKPVGRHLQFAKEYAGATILGNGQVALILDVAGVAAKASLTSKEAEKINEKAGVEAVDANQEMSAFLLFRNSQHENCGVPLELVARVDAIANEDIEYIGGRRVTKYSGGLLPLITLKDVVDVKDICEESDKIAIVFEIASKEIGLLATLPINVSELVVNLDQKTLKQKGIMGSMVINDTPTMLLDIFELVESTYPQWIKKDKPSKLENQDSVPLVLIAEDADFFKFQIRSYIEEQGYKTIVTSDGVEAWEALNKNGSEIDIVVTDIEMPNMNGLVLTEKIRKDARFKELPVIAVTSLSNEKDISRGMAAGINDYLAKLDKEKLIKTIDHYLAKDKK